MDTTSDLVDYTSETSEKLPLFAASKFSPARLVLHEAVTQSRHNKSQIEIFLSDHRGFMPIQDPLKSLNPEFSAWDQIAAELPRLYRDQRLRHTIANELPVLNADLVPDAQLCRASTIISILAQAYVRSENLSGNLIPSAIKKPWQQITTRLGRRLPNLSYTDLILYNWQVKANVDSTDFNKLSVENMTLLVPTVDTGEERHFYLTQVEIHAKATPLVNAVTTIQDAVLAKDNNTLKQQFMIIKQILETITEISLLKIDPNPLSPFYVDPVVWAKTVAPFAVPIKETEVPGPSGTSSPIFHLLDVFFERNRYDSLLGQEALKIRDNYPSYVKRFIDSVAKISVVDYVKTSNDPELKGMFQSMYDAYCGKDGFLTVHRVKVYGFLQLAFKVGRSVTIGGFKGLFKDRTWKVVDDELEDSRKERDLPRATCPFAAVSKRESIDTPADNEVVKVSLDISNQGIAYRAGDRCAIVARNNTQEVNAVLKLMPFDGNEKIKLNNTWIKHFELIACNTSQQTSLRELLSLGNIRKLSPTSVSMLMSYCTDQRCPVKHSCSLEQLLKKVPAHKQDTFYQHFINHICTVIDPETPRMYSISSPEPDKNMPTTIDLTVARVTMQENRQNNKKKLGLISGQLTDKKQNQALYFPIHISHPPRFRLPENNNTPIVMFAGGSGIAPFRSFIQSRIKKTDCGENHLFFGTRRSHSFLYRQEWEQYARQGLLNVYIALSQENINLEFDGQTFAYKRGRRQRLPELMKNEEIAANLWQLLCNENQGGKAAVFYTCGKPEFAQAIKQALIEIIAEQGQLQAAEAKRFFNAMIASGRYMTDVFSNPKAKAENQLASINYSELIQHNNPEQGYWVIINDAIYDLTDFVDEHPGGVDIICNNAGRDASFEFKRVNHDKNSEVLSILSLFEIGRLAKPELHKESKKLYQKWLDFADRIVEMENTMKLEFSYFHKPCTSQECADEFTQMKAMMLVDAQARIFEEYIPEVQRNLKLTETYINKHHKDKISSEFNTSVSADIFPDRDILKHLHLIRVINLARFKSLANTVVTINQNYMTELKQIISAGLKIFESAGAQLSKQAWNVLFASLRNIHSATCRLNADLVEEIQTASRPLLLSTSTSKMRKLTMTDYDSKELIYVADALCGWCYGFAPVMETLYDNYATQINFRVLNGGLWPGKRARLMNDDLVRHLQNGMPAVTERTGQVFGKAFIENIVNNKNFIYDTEPAARALIALRKMLPKPDTKRELDFMHDVQRAFFVEGKDPTKVQTFQRIIRHYGLDQQAFAMLYASDELKRETANEFYLSAKYGGTVFPTLIMRHGNQLQVILQGCATLDECQSVINNIINIRGRCSTG